MQDFTENQAYLGLNSSAVGEGQARVLKNNGCSAFDKDI